MAAAPDVIGVIVAIFVVRGRADGDRGCLRAELVRVKISVARLEGPVPRLLRLSH